MAESKPQEYLTQVRNQYEVLPYPMRDPATERESFMAADGLGLDALNHFGWGGKRDLRKGARFLVAGQGTGDITVFLAEQLRGTDAEVVAIDLSTTSIGISKARLAQRGLTNVTHHHMSILDLPNAGFAPFDVIECSGVLHHLEDPTAGLAALASQLKEDGLMTIMVYALYGRMGVYLTQGLFKHLATDDMRPELKLKVAREFLGNIPKGNWMGMNNERFLPEIQWPDGSGIYDLFLHSTDRAYTVPEVYHWVGEVGLDLVSFYGDFVGASQYVPESYTHSPLLLALLQSKTEPERQTIAELMHGSMIKHNFYAAKEFKPDAEFTDDMVIVYSFRQAIYYKSFPKEMKEALAKVQIGQLAEKAETIRTNVPKLYITKGKYTQELVDAIDGKRTVGEIVLMVSRAKDADAAEVRAELEKLYRQIHLRHRAYLRHKDVPPYVGYYEIEERLKKIPAIPISES